VHDQHDVLAVDVPYLAAEQDLPGVVQPVDATCWVQAPHDLAKIRQPVLVANGDHDVMVASEHSVDMARRLPTPSS
jgi:pimeloyl-ACP methyl ester carboxylesterase